MRALQTAALCLCALGAIACVSDVQDDTASAVDAGAMAADATVADTGHADLVAVPHDRSDAGPPLPAAPGWPPLPNVGADAVAAANAGPTRTLRLPRVELLPLTGLERVVLPPRDDDVIGNGWGFGWIDADGDGDLDVLLSGAASGPPACLFENTSVVGDVRFADRPLDCLRSVNVIGAFAVELDGDARDELLVATTSGPVLWRFWPTPSQQALPATDPPCSASNAQAIDLDGDGRNELVLACQHIVRAGRPTLRVTDQAWRYEPDGTWTPLDEPWLGSGNTLALGVLDRNEDGLLDLAVVVDTFSGQVARNTREVPGGWATRCAPSDTCRFRVDPFVDDVSAWGSFMGVGVVRVEGVLRAVLTDWGLNRLIPLDGDGADEALQRGVARRPPTDRDLFHWGVSVDDWNADGLDDLFIAQGTVPYTTESAAEGHTDALLLQQPTGAFITLSESVGIPPLAGAGLDGAAARSRGIARADLDGDGVVEILIAPLEGPYRLLRIGPPEGLEPAHCTLAVQARFGRATRAGWALGPSQEGPWHLRDIAGQHQVGTSPLALSSWTEGAVRFSSGAVVPFACAPRPSPGAPVPAPIPVVEPEWLRVTFDAREARAELDEAVRGPVRTADAAVRRADGSVERRVAERVDGGFAIALEATDVAVMWRFERRWVDRWFLR